jgi:Flp pilus assembly protein CpaB
MSNSTLQLPQRPVQTDNSSNMTLVVVAIVMGLLTVAINTWYIGSIRKQIEKDSFIVYKFSHNIDAGHKLNVAKDLVPQLVPNSFIKSFDTAITSLDIDARKDQPLLRPAQENELLTHGFFTGGSGLLDQKVTTGKRAVALDINSRNTTGLLRPGMYIDLSANFIPPDSKPRNIVVIEHLRVIAVGGVTDDSSKARSSFSTVTVELEPQVIDQLLTIQKYIGKDGFDVRVRNPGDDYTKYVNINEEILRLVGLKL